MSHSYQAVGWNRQKKIYDTVLISGVALYLIIYVVLNSIIHPSATLETNLIRAFGTAAIILLHIILSIGPLCRLDRRFLPLLYNRRHMGVTMFLLGMAHGVFAVIQFHSLGDMNPLASIFLSNTNYNSIANFPFQPLGLMALIILFLMAATSHDFWLTNLTAPVWKSLHMMVYAAYALVIAHVVLGALQTEKSPVLAILLGIGFVWILGLHIRTANRENTMDQSVPRTKSEEGFVEVCHVNEISDNRAKIVCLSGERIAVFRYDGKISAVSNVCQHQNGPLGEGRIINCKIVCPWHGYEYNPETGASPPPFTEKVPTFETKIKEGRVLVNPIPNPPGTRVEPSPI